jgi:hypothetical protein
MLLQQEELKDRLREALKQGEPTVEMKNPRVVSEDYVGRMINQKKREDAAKMRTETPEKSDEDSEETSFIIQ